LRNQRTAKDNQKNDEPFRGTDILFISRLIFPIERQFKK
jgi:hypothetical protein